MKQQRPATLARGLAVTLGVFALLLALAVGVVNALGSSSDGQQLSLIEDTVHNALMTCYALEGAYPPDLTYLRENYNLAYDDARYVVFYDAFASNIMPRVRVRVRGDERQ